LSVLGTPRPALRGDLARLAASPFRRRPLPEGVRALADGDPEVLGRLGVALHRRHRRALAPFRPWIRAQADADRAMRARAVPAGRERVPA
jgi:hypothetical protein